jgi:DNA recombination protein RmuC
MHNLIYYLIAASLILIISIIYFNLKNLLNLFNQNIQNINLNQNSLRDNLSHSLSNQTESMTKQMLHIGQLLENKMETGLAKNTETFTDIVKRLALIDHAQKNIIDISTNLLNLQNILIDKKSRGAFGEIQLKNLIENMLSKENFKFQHTLSNGTRCDCLLLLPPPTGNIAIDAKFPLENFQKSIDPSYSETDKQKNILLFKQNIKKHIEDISSKYILANETTDGAIMFIPAEAIFSEIHANHIDLVELSYRKKVWMVSPTTMMAILTTASSVLKDQATKKNIAVIQEHLRVLSQDFQRFNERINKLAKHIELSWQDAQLLQTSAQKISSKFNKIEQAELKEIID